MMMNFIYLLIKKTFPKKNGYYMRINLFQIINFSGKVNQYDFYKRKRNRIGIKSKSVHLFVRKIRKEDGIIMPYIYLGRGQLTNPRESNNIKKFALRHRS